jgi:hypothetical protein
MSFTLVQNILGTECIGSSREKIVNNFVNLESGLLSLSGNTIYPNDTNTVDITYNNNTRLLQADLKTNSIQAVHLQTNSVTNGKIINEAVTYSKLDSTSVIPRLAKAWVVFDGVPNPPVIKSQFNVAGVTKNSTGDYTITFTDDLGTPDYSICGTSRYETTTPTNNGFGSAVSIHPTINPTTSEVRIWNTSFRKINIVTNVVFESDSSLISVQIFD